MNWNTIFKSIVFFAALALTTACTSTGSTSYSSSKPSQQDGLSFPSIHEKAADNLLKNCSLVIDNSKPIIVTSLVDIDQMKKSSTLGRMSSEIVAGRLAQHGLKVREIKMGQTEIFISQEQGEFILSRNLHKIGEKHHVQGFVVGTYAIGNYNRYDVDVFISLRFVNTDNIIVCSENYVVMGTDPQLWK